MIIQIGAKVWINVLQIVSVELSTEFSRANKLERLQITMSNGTIHVVNDDIDGLLSELENYRLPTKSGKGK